ncbi:MAG: hypothetical protein L3J73_01805, partial [Thermoplasmata archaeon]|nr:hypothetical protein [Thermoplasmata archaeon]
GAGGVGLLTLIALYLELGGHVSSIIAAPLGGAIAALAVRASRATVSEGGNDAPLSPAELARRDTLSVWAMVRGVDLYLSFLFAGVGAELLAFVPSVVRTLHPNSVLFPIVALAAVFVASLGAAAFRAAGDLPVRSVRWVAALALAALSTVALLAVVPPYLDGSSTLLASAITGAGVASLVLLLGGRSSTQETAVRSAGRSAVPVVGLAFLLLFAFRFGSGAWSEGGGVTDPSLGAYGLGLASVALTGCLAGVILLDLGERFAAPTPVSAAPWTDSAPGATLTESGAALVGLAAVLGSIVFLLGALALVPLEIGSAPSDFVAAANPGAIGLLVGLLLGLLLCVWTIVSVPIPTQENPAAPATGVWPERYLVALAPIGAGIVAPLCVAWGLGAPGVLGFAIGSTLAVLGLSGLRRFGPTDAARGPEIAAPMLILIIVTTVAFGGAMLAGSFGGHL